MVNWKRRMAATLAAALLVTSVSAQFVFANDAQTGGVNTMEEVDDTADADLLNYVAVDKPYVELGETQSIVISVGGEDTEIDSAQLTYHRQSDGRIFNAEVSVIHEDGLLFEIPCLDESEIGAYILDTVSYEIAGDAYTVELSGIGIEAMYGFETEVETEPDAEVTDTDTDDDLEISVITFDDGGNAVSEELIENVIEESIADSDTDAESEDGSDQTDDGTEDGSDQTDDGTEDGSDQTDDGTDDGSDQTDDGTEDGSDQTDDGTEDGSDQTDDGTEDGSDQTDDGTEDGSDQTDDGTEDGSDQTDDGTDSGSGQTDDSSGSGSNTSGTDSSSARNVVIVLDPGHDADHPGARANGLKEEELTLKIAQYCKAKLETYSGVTVYMTRSGSACPYSGTTSVQCNKNRVAYAASVGADMYVSIHLNSSSSSSAKGAEVYYPNSNYNAAVGTQGKALASSVLEQLVSLGLYNRGIKLNDDDGYVYPDGSTADDYTVIYNSKLNGFPGIIIEHAFLTNSSDVSTWLSSEAGLKSLGEADAVGIMNYVDASNVGSSSSVNTGNMYYFKNTIASGDADKVIAYGKAADEVYVGDWDGDGVDTLCVRRGNLYYIKNSISGGDADVVISYGKDTDEVYVGDWDGDGVDTLCVRRGNLYYIKNSITSGDADDVIAYGKSEDEIYIGDWDGNGTDTLCVRRSQLYYIKNSMASGEADTLIAYGKNTDTVLVGDWDGDNTDTLCVRRDQLYYIKNSITSGEADDVIAYGKNTDSVYVGDWDGDGTDTFCVRR